MRLLQIIAQFIIAVAFLSIFFLLMPLIWVHHVDNKRVATYQRLHPPQQCDYHDPKGSGLVNPFCYDEKRDGPDATGQEFQRRQQEQKQ